MVGLSPTPPSFRPPNAEEKPNPVSGGLMALGIILGILLLIGTLGQCSQHPAYNNTAAFVDGNVSNAIASQPPPPPAPLSLPAVNRGTGHLRLAVNAEGFSGAMIYSQNCYDALAHQFSWAKLDTCGAFDMLAVRSIADADTAGLDNEAGYFQSEAAAGRYLAAATAAGDPASEADTRLSDLQNRVRRSSLVGRRVPPVVENTTEPLDNVSIPDEDEPVGEDD